MPLSVETPTSTSQNDMIIQGDEHEPSRFKQFDVVSDHSDHHYSTREKKELDCFHQLQVDSKLHKKIMQEWKILQKHLPDSIYVRVYDTRVDLLSAVVVGASGTPYHDALFFFDIAFPSDYPNSPPRVYYQNVGRFRSLNPNIKPSGAVLMTPQYKQRQGYGRWWDPSGSKSILQVLVSIQTLVLSEKPLLRVPCILPISRAMKEIVSRNYNEVVFASVCQTTLFLLRSPPKNFEALIAEHFRQRASVILRACNAYANGNVLVGNYKDEHDHHHDVKVSWRLIINIQKYLYPQLVAAFERNGASLGDLAKPLEVKRRTKPLEVKRRKPSTPQSIPIFRRVAKAFKIFFRGGCGTDDGCSESKPLLG